MDQDLVKRRHRELSKQQAMYVAHRERGTPREQSAVLAGYPAGQKAGDQVESQPTVQAELQKARESLAKATGITRQDIVDILMEAVGMARVMADPQAMVRAASEMAKLLGLNAPEVRKIEHGLNPADREALKALSDSDLHRLAKGRVIDAEVTVVEDKKV